MEVKSLAALALSALLCSNAVNGASPEQPLIAVGIPLAGDTSGSYLFLQSEAVATAEVYQVFRKTGNAAALNPYQLVGQMRPQTDPRTINALLARGEALFDDDRSALNEALGSLLQAVAEDPAIAEISLAAKLSTLIDFASSDAEIRRNLRVLAKRFKGVGLCMGIAYAETASGLNTYELRRADAPEQDPFESKLVVARLTVDSNTPSPLLPAPTKLTAVPMTDSRGHAVVRLRWATPDALLARGPVHFGYQLYRDGNPVNNQPILPQAELSESEANTTEIQNAIQARFKIPTGWNTTATAAALLADPAYAFPLTEADRDNDRQSRIAQQQQLEALQRVYHCIDDGGLSAGNGSGLVPGTTHTYTVAALDVLGRSGAQSNAIIVTVPGLEPPDAPKEVEVLNAYSYDAANQSSTQQLKVQWPALLDSNGAVRDDVAYLVYRWNSPTEYLRYREYAWGHGSTELGAGYNGAALPPIGLVAAPADLSPAQNGVLEWTDPTVDINYQSLQVYYTVRAVTDSGNGFPAPSGHSSPAMGVLRDREGPGSATILGNLLPCPNVSITCITSDGSSDTDRGPDNSSILELEATVANADQIPYFKGAIFSYKTGPEEPETALDYVEFDSNGVARARAEFSGIQLPNLILSCRVMLANGFWTTANIGCTTPSLKGYSSYKQRFQVEFLGYESKNHNACGNIYYPYEVDGTEIDPSFEVTPATDTFAYSFFRRVDNGELELIRNVEVDTMLSAADALTLIDEAPPNFFKRLCYYYQGRDQHGNPGPLQRIDCLAFAGPQSAMPQAQITRVYRTEGSTNSNAGLTLEFFCPPEGVESFLIEVRTAGGDLPLTLSAYDANQRGISGTVIEKSYPEGHRYAAYSTVAASLLSQQAGVFSIDFGGISPDVSYVFRVIARGPYYADPNAPAGSETVLNAVEGEVSDEVTGNWRSLAPREDSLVPTVRWPARPNHTPIPLIGNPSLNPSGPIGIQYIDVQHNDINIWKGVGLEVAQFLLADETKYYASVTYPAGLDGPQYNGKTEATWPELVAFLEIDQPENWTNKIYELTIPGPLPDSAPITRSLFPCILYRIMVDANGDPVTGDLVQCSPLIGGDSTFAMQVVSTVPSGIILKDPFLLFGEGRFRDGDYGVPLYLKDNQPVIRGEIYQYYLALTDARGEIASVIDLGTVTIP